jgi:hypothetical protein
MRSSALFLPRRRLAPPAMMTPLTRTELVILLDFQERSIRKTLP